MGRDGRRLQLLSWFHSILTSFAVPQQKRDNGKVRPGPSRIYILNTTFWLSALAFPKASFEPPPLDSQEF